MTSAGEIRGATNVRASAIPADDWGPAAPTSAQVIAGSVPDIFAAGAETPMFWSSEQWLKFAPEKAAGLN